MWEKKLELKRRYDSTAEMYDRRYEEIQNKKFKTIEEHFDGKDRILDVGCGTGLFMNKLRSPGRLVIGVDFSTQMLKKAMERSGNQMLISADADKLPFRSETFDLAMSLTLIQNLPDPRETIQEMARVTEPGGKVIVTGLEKKYSTGDMEELLNSAGLKTLKVGQIPDSEDTFCVGKNEIE